MNADERTEQIMLLAVIDGWDKDRFAAELQERYPHGPEPDGSRSWDVDELWARMHPTDDDYPTVQR